MLEDLPEYEQNDPTIAALINAVANEAARIDTYLTELREKLQPARATGDMLRYWEHFLDLPVEPEGITEDARRDIVKAAIAKRTAGAGKGWVTLLNAVMAGGAWEHGENEDEDGSYAAYNLHIRRVNLLAGDWRIGIFKDMVKKTVPAHLHISEIEIAGSDTFRVGISEVGDEI